ncbi:MAG: PIG-L family deacetylase [Anaerolineales bacterium]|nr:PIG-L family deacetylase [Anaerolineales bacterium]
MEWVYLSPHLDDVAFSCGGLVWEQSRSGKKVGVWTICAGDPPNGPLPPLAERLHARWGIDRQAVSQRRSEDENSCRLMGAAWKHFTIPDCIYRRSTITGVPYYPEEDDIFGRLHHEEVNLVEKLTGLLALELPKDTNLVIPLGIGDHVDHSLVRLAAENLDRPLLYYADYPYVLKSRESDVEKYEGMEVLLSGLTDQSLQVWEDAVTAYGSQISTFWQDEHSAKQSIREYHHKYNGVRLWQPVGG